MKLRLIAPLVILFVTGLSLFYSYSPVFSDPTGAPAGYCGSVVNPSSCATNTACHYGTTTPQTGWITSTIPVTGYVPGTIYTITATATYTGRVKFGFQISPQNTAGTYLGLCIVTSSTTTKLVTGSGVNASRKYMTHTSAGTTGTSGYHTWSFNWTAPAAGSGNVTFYGTFLCSNNNGNETGDICYSSNLPVTENVASGMAAYFAEKNSVSVYPNPASDYINLNYAIDRPGKVTIKLYDAEGRMSSLLLDETKSAGDYSDHLKLPLILNSGIYFLEIVTETNKVVKRILVQQ